MALETLADYHCTEAQLYSISKAIYSSLGLNLPDFFVYSPSYILGHVTGLLGVRTAAMGLPNEVQRAEAHELLLVDVKNAGTPCLQKFQILKGYIKKAYPSTFTIMYNSAGMAHYEKGANGNWVELKALNDDMNTFLANATHVTALVAGLNMPPAFPASVSLVTGTFDSDYTGFITAKTTTTAKNAKIAANNVLFGQLMAVCDDGKKVYINNQGQMKLFTFDTVKDLLSPPGSASYKLTAKVEGLLTPIKDLPVKIQSKTAPAIIVDTDVNGVALFPHLDPDNYTVTVGVVAMPFIVQSFKKDVDTGTDAHSEVFMTPSV
ncbi:MAG: hypothetical protein WCL14_02285 [Bacteroidota bacterium]